jgi:hypothetical protein
VKPFAWSYSKLRNHETCPLRYYECDVLRHFKEESDQLKWGDQVHKVMAAAVSGTGDLPADYSDYQSWVDDIRKKPGEILVEQKYALRADFTPCEYFSPKVWARGIADVVQINGDRAELTDYKSGRVNPDTVQLMLQALMVFAHHPEVNRIKARFAWLQHDDTTECAYGRPFISQYWATVLPRVQRLEAAHATNTFLPKPNYLCKRFCPVTSCFHNGK